MADGGTGYGQMGSDGLPLSSLPWQERQRHSSGFAALLKTIRTVLLEPSDAFSHIRVDGSLGSSMLYVVILGTLGNVVAILWQVLLNVGLALPVARQGPEMLAAQLGGMGVFVALWIVVAPLMMLIGSLIGALVLHACLWMVGGARQSFEATYAVLAYASGSTAVLNLVPFCGGMVAGVWTLVVEIIGLARVHECSTGRAVLAVLLPMIVCCGGAVLVFTSVIAVAAAGAAH